MPSPVYNFVATIFSQEQPPQTANIIVDGYDITIQYIPQQGFIVGYQDRRVIKNNYVMTWADIVFEQKTENKRLKDMTPEQLREYVMNSPTLDMEDEKPKGLLLNPPTEETRHLITDGNKKIAIPEGELSPPVDIPSSIQELVNAINQVAEDADELYKMNSIMYLKPKGG